MNARAVIMSSTVRSSPAVPVTSVKSSNRSQIICEMRLSACSAYHAARCSMKLSQELPSMMNSDSSLSLWSRTCWAMTTLKELSASESGVMAPASVWAANTSLPGL